MIALIFLAVSALLSTVSAVYYLPSKPANTPNIQYLTFRNQGSGKENQAHVQSVGKNTLQIGFLIFSFSRLVVLKLGVNYIPKISSEKRWNDYSQE